MTLFELKGTHMYHRVLLLAIAAGYALAAGNAVAAPVARQLGYL
jgi:hypothetical protein